MARVLLGQLLKDDGLLVEDQLRCALAHQKKWGCRIGQSLLRLRLVTPGQLLAAASRQLGVPADHLGDRAVPPAILRRLPEKLIRKRRVLPLDVRATERGLRLVVAFAAAEDLSVVDEVAFAAGLRVEPVLVSDDDMDRALARHGFAEPIPARREALELPELPDEPMQLLDGRVIAA
jgi:type IV pilus assembly protein PilB